MSKRLKSFHKLFFIVIFSILFSGVIGSSNSPELPEKIAPELEQIEALPRRTKPAELNIEVTKIKSEPLEEIYIDRENKNIYVDFSKKKEQTLKGVRNAEDLEKKYNLIISEKVQSSGEVIGKGRTKMTTNPQVMAYETAELNGKKMLKIPYENEPEKLYISVQENNQVIKVYSMDIQSANPFQIGSYPFYERYTLQIGQIQDLENLNLDINFGSLGIEQTAGVSGFPGEPFPVMALGPRTGTNGWSFSAWNNYIPQRNGEVIATYGNGNEKISVKVYFKDPTNLVTSSTINHVKRGSPLTVFGIHIPNVAENIEAKLTGVVTTNLIDFKSILENFRNENIREKTFELQVPTNINEQISFIIGSRDLNSFYYFRVPYSDSNTYVKNINYPNIKLVKPLIQETLTLNIGSGFNIDSNIVFTQNGINSILGASLTPTNTRNLKSLHFASKFKLKNNSNETSVIDVDTTGNSTSSNEFIITNGSNELKLSLQYKNKYPEIKILNAAKAGTYTLNIVHYEPSTLERLNYTLNIVLQNDLVLPEPGMIRTNVLKEFIIEDDIENETYKIINSDLGILTMQQTKTIPAGDLFPFITLGAKDGSTGWSFDSASPSKARGADIIINYRNDSYSQYPLNLKMSLEKNISLIGATEIGVSNNNVLTGIGFFKLNENEKTSALLKGSLETKSSEGNLLDLLKEFRSRSEREVILTPIEELENQISYVIGDYKNNTYTVPTNITLSSVDKKVDSIKFPNIKIRKPLLEENVTLTIPSTYDIKNPILFNENGVNNGETTSDKDRYLKSLYYDSSFNINGATLKNITNSSSPDDYNITLNNGDNQLVMKVKYENNYPKFTFLNNPSPGTYTLNIKHYDPVGNQRLSKGLERLDYTVDIVVLDSTSSTKEFDVTSSLRDIVILPDGKIESPDNWIKMVQLVSDKGKFPVIGINRPSWEIQTDRSLNPIDKKPTAILDLESFGKIEVPVNIRETPYQNTEKFLVYDRGDMTNRNIAVGAYTSLTSTNGSGLNNKVQVDFQVFLNLLSQTEIQKILNYAGAKFTADPTKTKVEIPYSTTNVNGSTLPIGYHKIYSIRGLQKVTSKIFDVNQTNILDYGTLDFPKIVVLKNETFNTNTATLNFINPVPKSAGDISGTFDIALGVVAPNNLQAYNHPSSLTVSGVSSLWNGFTTIPEYHKIRIFSVTETKEFTTTEGGDMKGTQTITSGNNSYVFMKGKISPLAVGVLSWDFQQKTDDIIKLQHLNSSGRVVAEDVYRINLATFNPSIYLDKTNSTMLNTINSSNKSLTITANVRQDFVDLGGLKLQNYQKDITKTGTLNTTTGLYANEVRVEVYSDLLTLNDSNSNSIIKLKGRLKFDSEKTNISAPNELGSLRFILDSSNNLDDIAGKTFTITKPAGLPLVSIKGGGKQDEILNTLTITLQEKQSGALPNMSFVSTLTALTVKESSLTNGTLSLRMPGQMTLRQLDGGQGNSVPAIALGDYNDWKILLGSGVTRTNPRTRAQLPVTYQIGTTNITLYPELSNPIASVDGSQVGVDGQPILSSDIRLYTERDNASPSRILTALTYVRCRNTRNERITTGLTLNIAPNQLTALMDALKTIPGDKVELKAIGNKARVAYIHGKDEGTSGVCGEGRPLTLPADTLSGTSGYAFETLPSIFIEKEKLYKNVEINVLPGYVLDSKIIFNSVNNIVIPTGIQVIPEDNRVFEGLGYQHTVKLTLPGGEIKTYTTDSTGKLLITENVEKNGKSITLNIQYRSGKDVDVWISERTGSQYFDFVLQHLDPQPSGDVRRTTNIRINSGVEGSTAKLGEMDFVISSRYNATEAPGQLISNPLTITSTGITYQTEVLDLKLLNGDFPEAPGVEKSIEVKDSNGSNNISIVSSGGQGTITLANGTILKVIKTGSDLTIKPLKWSYNATDKFILTYKNGTTITNQYTFNVICPEFFVASVGVLDFGKIYKLGNPADKTVTTNIELEYKDGTVQATYSLDVSQSNLDGNLTNSLYLNDEKTLLVKDLHLGSESGAGNIKRILPLTGTVDGNSVKNTNPGVYQKTIQILIHLQ